MEEESRSRSGSPESSCINPSGWAPRVNYSSFVFFLRRYDLGTGDSLRSRRCSYWWTGSHMSFFWSILDFGLFDKPTAIQQKKGETYEAQHIIRWVEVWVHSRPAKFYSLLWVLRVRKHQNLHFCHVFIFYPDLSDPLCVSHIFIGSDSAHFASHTAATTPSRWF